MSVHIYVCVVCAQCQCEPPESWVNEHLLLDFWNVVYWSSQLLTWLVLPITEAYMSAGDFTFLQRLKSSLKENAIVYGSLLVCQCVCRIPLPLP